MKSGSAAVPVYRMESGGRVRFAVAYYRDGKRLRQVFQTLDAAKKEAQLVAQRIQSGMQQMTDLKPHDRETYLAVRKMADDAGLPLVSAMEDYLRARKMAGTESLASMAAEYSKHFGNVTRRATIPEVVAQILASPSAHKPGLMAVRSGGSCRLRMEIRRGPTTTWTTLRTACCGLTNTPT